MSIAGPLLTALLMLGCSDDYRRQDYEAGSNGEPPKVLEQHKVYTAKLVAEQKNYVLALGQIHSFLITNDFLVVYPSCFDDVLDIRVTAIVEKHKKRFPCVVLQGVRGLPVKVYLSVTVEDVMFNQLDGNNRLIYTVSMFGEDDLVRTFKSEVAPALEKLGANPLGATRPAL